jgi:hypothetical protein
MAQAALVNEKIESGAALVRARDRAKVPLRAAYWLYDSSDDVWRLILEAMPDKVGKIGPMMRFSQSIHDAVANIPSVTERESVSDLLVEDVELYTRPSPIAQHLRPSLGQAATVYQWRMRNSMVNGYLIEGVLLYRLEPGQTIP